MPVETSSLLASTVEVVFESLAFGESIGLFFFFFTTSALTDCRETRSICPSYLYLDDTSTVSLLYRTRWSNNFLKYLCSKKNGKTRHCFVLLGTIWTMLLISTTHWSTGLAYLATQIFDSTILENTFTLWDAVGKVNVSW